MTDSAPNQVVRSFAADDTFLLTYLSDHDAPCPLCEYNLRGLTSPRCPECGQQVQLSVSLVEPYLKAWIATVVSLLLPAGVGVLFLIADLREGWPRRMPFWGVVGMVYVIGCIPLSFSLLTLRRQFLQLGKPMQRGLAALGWSALIVSLITAIIQMG